MSDPIKVKATKPGFYDNAYRKVGDVFLVTSDMFEEFWMEEADAPVQEQSQEALKAQRENRESALQDLGDALAGNPSAAAPSAQFDSMSDADLAAYYETVLGEKPARAAKRETLIAKITDKLNAD